MVFGNNKRTINPDTAGKGHTHAWRELTLIGVYKSRITKIRRCDFPQCSEAQGLIDDKWHPMSPQNYELVIIQENNIQQGRIQCPICGSDKNTPFKEVPSVLQCTSGHIFHINDVVRAKAIGSSNDIIQKINEMNDRVACIEKLAATQLKLTLSPPIQQLQPAMPA